MTIETDSSIALPTVHAPQFYADFGPQIASNKNEQLPLPHAYTAIEIPSTVNNIEHMKPFTDSLFVVNELVNQGFSRIIQ
jgi:hypothetical protein